jgi:hypothetical protein
MMQPIVAGYDLDAQRFPRVDQWMKQVIKETAPYFDEAHAVPMRFRAKNSKS